MINPTYSLGSATSATLRTVAGGERRRLTLVDCTIRVLIGTVKRVQQASARVKGWNIVVEWSYGQGEGKLLPSSNDEYPRVSCKHYSIIIRYLVKRTRRVTN